MLLHFLSGALFQPRRKKYRQSRRLLSLLISGAFCSLWISAQAYGASPPAAHQWTSWRLPRAEQISPQLLNEIEGLAIFDPSQSPALILPWVAAGGRLLIALEARSAESCAALLGPVAISLSGPSPSRSAFNEFRGLYPLWWHKSQALDTLSPSPLHQPILANVPVFMKIPERLSGRRLKAIATFDGESPAALHFSYGLGQVLFFADATALSDLMYPLPMNQRLIQELKGWLSQGGAAVYGDRETTIEMAQASTRGSLLILTLKRAFRELSVAMARLHLGSMLRLLLRLIALIFIIRFVSRLFLSPEKKAL